MVLLKNENHILPLNFPMVGTKAPKLALLGPYAGRAMNGGDGSSNALRRCAT
jgi:hypothetical protein